MKKRLFSILVLLALAFSVSAQDFKAPQLKPADPSSAITSSVGLSSSSAMLMADLLQHKDIDQLRSHYPIMDVDGQTYVQAFVEAAGTFQNLESYGVLTSSTVKDMATALIPLDRFVSFVRSGLCSWVEVGNKVSFRNETARSLTHVDQVYAGQGLPQGYDGTGVVVGVIDVGFEYGHPTFYDSTGNTLRVKRVWNQDANGTHPSGYSYGAEYTTPSAILAAAYSADDETHGTHVAGIACGSGGKTSSTRKYRGMAPNADIVLVATNLEDASVYDGITYIADYARSVGKPCVINMSLGGHVGPHDGTSSFDRQSLAYTNAHPNGLLLVGACGNEGDEPLHVSKTFSASDTVLYTFIDITYADYGYPGYVDIWGAPNTDISVGVAIYNPNTGQYSDQSSLYSSAANNTYEIALEGNRVDVEGYVYCMGRGQYNQRPNITLYLEESSSSYYANEQVMLIIKSTSGTVHAWGTYATFDDGGVTGVTSGNSSYTVGELGGSGEAMISVGSYQSNGTLTNISGSSYDFSDGHSNGDISYYSSVGPTADGRTKPEITAPGQLLVSSFNRFDNSTASYSSYYAVATETFDGHTEWWGGLQGTSMASPAVCGIMALWLQANPQLTIAQAKQMLKTSAITDSFTGTIPATGDYTWGWGKVNALGGFNTTETWYSVISSANDDSFGSVTGAGSYPANTSVTLTAVPASGYAFSTWSNGVTANPYTFTLVSDTTINATFVATTGIDDPASVSFLIRMQERNLSLLGADGQPVVVMDVMGRIVAKEDSYSGSTFQLPARGVYMVKVGRSAARKVIAR